MTMPAFLLSSYAMQIPLLLVWLVGLVLAITNWRKQPSLSLLTLGAVTIYLVFTILGPLVSALFIWLGISGQPASTITIISIVWQIINTLAHLAAWIMLLVAIFGARKAQ